ncbi:MAG: hypothetical protein EA421_05985 [Gemmatimonadales bacterium]|nr:MAG: hypothetical protein EA421_05985 [Gemmatimonadales bacterium]
MPNVTLHLALAERVLSEWRLGSDPPFSPRDPILVNAFRSGALGPDLGYFPGGPRFLSDLAHCVGSGTLTQALLSGAETARERAFAWGWVTHVLADRKIHPLVGRGVSVLKGGSPAEAISGDAAPEAHIRVETGVDVWISSLEPDLREIRLEPVFDAVSIRFLQAAYQRTYGIRVGGDPLLTGHHAATRLVGPALTTMGHLANLLEAGDAPGLMGGASRRAGRLFAGLAGFATDRLGAGGMALALLTPVSPPAWLRLAVAEVLERFPGATLRVQEEPEENLPDVNLDTGAPDGSDPTHETSERTVATLERMVAEGSRFPWKLPDVDGGGGIPRRRGTW